MPRANTCKLDERVLTVKEAIELRDSARKNGRQTQEFRCVECDGFVSPHNSSTYGDAHFEHRVRNPKCKLSDPAR
jgi:hypothetical protein